eukprot:TRINITY_DN16757_c0_g1_i1.p1 TRINITY_DN16757_c0_g1~~TRINITY_DN16757_c0_g1_i1.p1  ORF type:complete len:487 (+),score=100.02 TRINITY_DN16757_c0_g1_i1:68-1462(+)
MVVVETEDLVVGEDDEGNKTINEYAVIQEIGRGAYGKVKLVVHIETDQFFALKIINKSTLARQKKGDEGKTRLDDVYYEIAVMKKFRHPNVVSLHEVINDSSSQKVYLLLDYVQNGPIWAIGMPPLPDEQLKRSLVGMCQGLDYIHTNNVLHRDIKPDNLLVDEAGVVRWCDFGVSSTRDKDGDGIDDMVVDTEGTPAFLTPEQIKNEPIQGRMTDMWALGATLYCISFGRLPFTGSNVREISDSIVNKEPDYGPTTAGTEVDPELVNLHKMLLNKNLSERLGMKSGVHEILAHKYLSGCEGTEVVAYPVEKVTDEELDAAVLTGHNIQLKLANTVNAAMKVQHFKIKLLAKKRRQIRLADSGTIMDDLPLASPTDEANSGFVPLMSPETPAFPNNDGNISPLTQKPLLEPSLYLLYKRIPFVIDKAIRDLVAKRPANAAAWLAEYFRDEIRKKAAKSDTEVAS